MGAGKRERIVWIDQLRALAMLLVITGHVCTSWGNFQGMIYSFHMPLFFVISGMTFRPEKYESLGSLIKDKLIKVILPYFYLNMLAFPLWVYLYGVLGRTTVTAWDLLGGTLYGNVGVPGQNFLLVSGPTWYLPCLFFTEIIVYSCKRLAKKDNFRFFVLLLICGLAGYADMSAREDAIFPGFWNIRLAFTGAVFFGLGYLFIQQKNGLYARVLKLKCRQYLGALAGLGAMGLVAQGMNRRVSFVGYKVGSIFYFYFAALALSACCTLLMMKAPRIRLLTYIGQNTIVWMTFHTLLMRLVTFRYPQILVERGPAIGLVFALFIGITPIAWVINLICPHLAGKNRIQKGTIRNAQM